MKTVDAMVRDRFGLSLSKGTSTMALINKNMLISGSVTSIQCLLPSVSIDLEVVHISQGGDTDVM
jgi:hypothetical protein